MSAEDEATGEETYVYEDEEAYAEYPEQNMQVEMSRRQVDLSGGGGSAAAAPVTVEGEEGVGKQEQHRQEAGDGQAEGLKGAVGSAMNMLPTFEQMRTEAATAFQNVVRGRFRNWSKYELAEALVMVGIEIRNESRIPREKLMELAEELWEGKELPPRPPPPTKEDLAAQEHAALMVQTVWINKNIERARTAMLESMRHDPSVMGPIAPPGAGDGDEEMGGGKAGEGVEEEYDQELLGEDAFGSEQEKRERRQRRAQDNQGFEPPDHEYARQYTDWNHPRKFEDGKPVQYNVRETTTGRHCVLGGCGEQLDLWDEGQTSELGQFGPGITNYFKFVKWCTWVFFILSLMSTPSLIINSFGSGALENSDFNELSKWTLGNLGDTENFTEVRIPLCSHNQYHSTSCIVDKRELAFFYSYIDVCSVIFVLIAYAWLRIFEENEEKTIGDNTVTPSNYTIYIPHVPPDTTEANLKRHFERLFTKKSDLDRGIIKHKVAAVALGFNNADAIEKYNMRGQLVRDKDRENAMIRFINSRLAEGDEAYSQSDVKHHQHVRDQLTRDIERMNREIRHSQLQQTQAICAYVTFDSEEGFIKALYKYRQNWLRHWCMRPKYKFQGQRIRAKRSPEPSTILWENLQFTPIDRLRRRMFTSLIATFALMVSVVISFWARDFQEQAQNEGGEQPCPEDWSSWTTKEQKAAADANQDILHCYCGDLTLVQQSRDGLCQTFLRTQLQADLSTLIASLAVVGMNDLFTYMMRKMARWERHHSVESEGVSMFRRIFWLKFVNTGLIVLMLNSELVKEIIDVNIDSSEDFSTAWYMTAGASLILVMLFNMIGPHVPAIWRYRKYLRSLRAVKEDPEMAVTQDELNQIYLGPDFHASLRYAQLLVTFFVCWMYAPGIPLLLWIGTASFAGSYWIDKYLFLRWYKTPPRMNSQLGHEASAYIKLAIILHCAMAIWMYGNKNIFRAGSVEHGGTKQQLNNYQSGSVYDKISQKHTVPLFVLLCLVVAYMFLRSIFADLSRLLKRIVNVVCCGGGISAEELIQWYKEAVSARYTYTSALRRGLIKGLATYNILQNPKYKEAFAISDQFALSHIHVHSIAVRDTESTRNLEGAARFAQVAEQEQERRRREVAEQEAQRAAELRRQQEEQQQRLAAEQQRQAEILRQQQAEQLAMLEMQQQQQAQALAQQQVMQEHQVAAQLEQQRRVLEEEEAARARGPYQQAAPIAYQSNPAAYEEEGPPTRGSGSSGGGRKKKKKKNKKRHGNGHNDTL